MNNIADFHPIVHSLLETHLARPIPLSARDFKPQSLPPEVMSTDPSALFPRACDPRSALAGLLLIAGQWELSHQVAQDISSREGSYWHAIVHRIEPDSWNANYWFRQTGPHPIFADLHRQAAALLSAATLPWKLKDHWDPKLFLDWCDSARSKSGPELAVAEQIQSTECQLLFSWCALKTKDF